MILNSNKPLLDWGKILGGDDVLATAILDRLLHHAHIFNIINGNTYRLKDKRHMFLPDAKSRDKNHTSTPEPPSTT
jgi:DNA replication protein DnaC